MRDSDSLIWLVVGASVLAFVLGFASGVFARSRFGYSDTIWACALGLPPVFIVVAWVFGYELVAKIIGTYGVGFIAASILLVPRSQSINKD